MASPAAQVLWWAIPAFVSFVVFVALSGPTLGFVALAAFSGFGVLGAYRVLQGGGHRYPGIAVLMEGREGT